MFFFVRLPLKIQQDPWSLQRITMESLVSLIIRLGLNVFYFLGFCYQNSNTYEGYTFVQSMHIRSFVLRNRMYYKCWNILLLLLLLSRFFFVRFRLIFIICQKYLLVFFAEFHRKVTYAGAMDLSASRRCIFIHISFILFYFI